MQPPVRIGARASQLSQTQTRWFRAAAVRALGASEEDAETFLHELTFLLVNQYMSFNSPVWFNVGIEEQPQCSACFINSVKDSMASMV